MNYFIGDMHLGHKNVLSFDNRPFRSIQEHDNYIIEQWNKNVNENDDVYILGDVSWHNTNKTIEILKVLKGKKHLLIGNHDKNFLKSKQFRDLFVECCDYLEIQLDKKTGLVLSHWPNPCFNKHYYGWYHFYGHVHTGFEYNMMENVKFQMEALYTVPCNMYNVGVMMPYINYTPRTFEYIVQNAKTTTILNSSVKVD